MEIHKVTNTKKSFWEKKKTISIIVGLILASALALLAATYNVIESKRAEIVAKEKTRIEAYLTLRTQAFNSMIRAYAAEGDRLVKSDLFRLYATEVDAVEGDLSALVNTPSDGLSEENGELIELTAQLPLMQNMLREFAVYAGFLSARVFDTEGKTYLTTDIYLPHPTDVQTAFAIDVAKNGKTAYGPLRKTKLGLELDFFLPIFPPEGGEDSGKTVGVLLMTRQVTGALTAFLNKTPLSRSKESTHLVQYNNGVFEEITPWSHQAITPIAHFKQVFGEDLVFDTRTSIKGDDAVFSVAQTTVGGWIMVQEIASSTVFAPVEEFSKALYTIAWLGVFTVILVLSLGWWVFSGLQSRRDAEILANQAQVIENQRQFIDSINESIDDFILLKDFSGKYIYVNDAFARAANREKSSLLGLDDVAVFGFGTANRLAASDQQVMTSGQKTVVGEDVFLQSKHYHFQISKMPYLDQKGECIGVVQIFHDMTEVVAMQKKAKKLHQQTITALGATIEAVDPYLSGHTQLMVQFSGFMAKPLGLTQIENEELIMAANLSQIGKAFIPKNILSKPGKLSEEEIAIVESHVEHSCKILREIDVPENVLDTIAQMNERLDGSGYPKKLQGEAISKGARILSILNVFSALVSPRSYRAALSAEDAIETMERSNEAYDAHIMQVLKTTIETEQAKSTLAQLH